MFLPLSFSSDLQLQREKGEGERHTQREKEGEGEREVFSNRNEASRSRLFSRAEAVTAQFKTFCHAKQPKKPLKPAIWLYFEHRGNSFTSRSDSFQLWEISKSKSQLRDVKFMVVLFIFWSRLFFLFVCLPFYFSLSMKIIVSLIGKQQGVNLS